MEKENNNSAFQKIDEEIKSLSENKPQNPAEKNAEPDKKRPGTEAKQSGQNRNRRNYYQRRKNPAGRSLVSSKKNFSKVTILVPLLNEEESLRPLYNEIKKVFTQGMPAFEILFVDDGSTDKSLSVIKEIARNDNRVRYISFRKNYGKSAALQVGFKSAAGDAIITMDADLQDDPVEIPNLIKKLEEGFDLVSGWKKKRFDPIIKRQSSKFFNYVTRVMSGIKIHDFNCGLKAYRKEVVEDIKVYGELHRYIPVLADWEGYKITEIVVHHHPRRYGKTKFGISRFFKGFVDLITVLFTTRYIKRPMHLFGFLGAISFITGFAIDGLLAYLWWVHNMPLSNRPLLFLGMLLMIVGIQFFSVGLLGEAFVHNFQSDEEYSIKDKK